jgi:hypothetical protein
MTEHDIRLISNGTVRRLAVSLDLENYNLGCKKRINQLMAGQKNYLRNDGWYKFGSRTRWLGTHVALSVV